ncbi:very short patch repair endonuclease [Plantactinospora sp. KLBMP9567]|uniref:very short patch repair endonuclease n=1 Tax=Plantactinospora sp. KLBMP9567 TaxID=3085900 RepID=UPI002981C1A3|nr:very short patch repair endonuclease [Plantactinospora sp. KLBMP9567]MDW5328678.1 very short patch repair endonuclease [Plantactinospora sp. KLBMP9567]
MTPAARTDEQDAAAGGRRVRELTLPDGRIARASMALRLYRRTRRIRAYLRWSEGGVTREKYIGEVGQPTRAENLRAAWAMARPPGGISEAPAARKGTDQRGYGSWASSEATRNIMRANRGRDTKPEILLRARLHAMGLRYRTSHPPLPGLRRTADIVFSRAKVAVFVDGCYWHGCPDHHRPATKNKEFWKTKIDGNRARDAETTELLTRAGWIVIRVWEHEPIEDATRRVLSALQAGRT